MKKVSKEQVSRYRQDVSKLLDEIKRLTLKAGYQDLLFGGTPIEVYRTCGKENCRCSQGGDNRHGPYRAIQIRHGGIQRQITLRKDEGAFFEMAKNHQYQVANRERLVELQKSLLDKLNAMLEARTIWDKK